MQQAGLQFTVIPSQAEEVITSTHPAKVVEELSLQKAQEVAERVLKGTERLDETAASADGTAGAPASDGADLNDRIAVINESIVVIGADTVVAADHRILGKPRDHESAREMITTLQGNVHQVYTGVTLIVIGPAGDVRSRTFHECTDVDVYPMTDEEVEAYISTPEPYDKAGAYGIQGSFGIYIRGIHGCYYNVVGLPIARLVHELKDIMNGGA